MVFDWGFRCFSDIEGNITNKSIYAFSFLVGKHREPQSINAKLFLPIIPIGIVAYALTLLWDNLCRNSCILLFYVIKGPLIPVLWLKGSPCLNTKIIIVLSERNLELDTPPGRYIFPKGAWHSRTIQDNSHSRQQACPCVFCAGKCWDSLERSYVDRCSLNQKGSEDTTFQY